MITIIAAIASNGVIGKDGKLPWSIHGELKHFKERTINNTVVMGRRTYNSTAHPLINRNNIVISTTLEQKECIDLCRSYEEAIEKAKTYNKQIFIIGGTRVYKKALEHVNHMIISHLKKAYDGDTYFPEWNPEEWKVINEQDFGEYTIKEYKR
ncbi:MAG: dihydrofolate reductase [Candidatus Nanoarchaeia archaeon]